MPHPDIRELDLCKQAMQERAQDVAVQSEKVVQASLRVASNHFNQRAEDPGWQTEMDEENLAEAILDAAHAIHEYKTAKGLFEGKPYERPL